MQQRIPIGSMVAVRKFAGDEWEPMFVMAHCVWDNSRAKNSRTTTRKRGSLVCLPDRRSSSAARLVRPCR